MKLSQPMLLLWLAWLGSAGNVRADEGQDFFNEKVLPLVKTHCYKCHSHESGKSKGGLVLDSRAGILKGGASGPALIPGSPDKSLLIRAIRRSDPSTAMPPSHPLTAEEKSILERWVKMGAPDPRTGAALDPYAEIWAKSRTHWSLQPPIKPKPPAKADGGWSKSEIDDFVAARLGEQRLTAGPDALPRDLIRRLSFDITGLPPTFERVQRFERDYRTNTDEAVGGLVDELLASPHYGERWARYWLDLARYGDESGGARNRSRETRLLYAFTYRDYVIRALNDDKPYDQFIREQLAGDQIKLKDPRDQAAMGFLAIGSHQGSAAEIRAERIDTVGRVFLGLTVGCARCHDHKFDPISTEDYYALEGVFLSTQEIGYPKPPDPVRQFEACPIIEEVADPKLRAAREEAVARTRKAVAKFEDDLWKPAEAEWRALTPKVLRALAMTDQEFGPLGQKKYLRKNDIPIVLVMAWKKWLNLEQNRSKRKAHPIFDPWFKLSEMPEKEFADRAGKVLSAYSGSTINRPVMEALKDQPLRSARDLADAYSRLFIAVDREWQTDPRRAKLPDPEREAIRQVLYGPGAPPTRDPSKWRNAFGNLPDKKRNELLAKVSDALYAHPGSPARAMVLADKNPQDAFLLIRGEADQRGDKVRRGFLSVLGTAGRRQEFSRDASGRLELAHAIVDPRNPLTARVLVNRVWGRHFGRPLVESTDNFGLQTPEPVHRALLDWLAATFIEDGWSLKKLHRRILLSRVYRQSAIEHADFAHHQATDPENKYLWRMNVRRLDFEPLRDSVLAVCGTLDATVHGRSVDVVGSFSNPRRTIYALIDRPVQPLLLTFGVPDNGTTSGERHQSTSAAQTLYLMNSGLLGHHAGALLENAAFGRLTTLNERAAWLYRRLLQRDPTAREMESLARFLRGRETDAEAWRELVQALLMSNEFAHTL
jgi:hypothetical protein